MKIQQNVEFVKRQIEYHERRYQKFVAKGDHNAASLHEKLLSGFKELYEAMQSDIAAYSNIPSTAQSESVADLDALLKSPTQLVRSHLSGLPEELLQQLQISDSERFQWQVIDLVDRAANKIISIEVLLIALFHATGKVFDRTELANRIYRMMKKELLFGVPGKKGWYTTVPQPGAQLTLEPNGEEEETL